MKRKTSQRAAIDQVFCQLDRPLGIEEILETGRMAVESLNQATVYRNVKLLLENGWTWMTALCVMVFSMFHWPCSTACWTIWKETRSLKWTGVSFLLPTALGLALCYLLAALGRALGV